MQALTDPLGHERTQAAARRQANGPVTFETEWIRPGPERDQELAPHIQRERANGSAQIYESDKGRPIIALNYWRVLTEAEQVFAGPTRPDPERKRNDHTDDLYFRRGRTKLKKKMVDPNQLDMFPEERTETTPDKSED